MLYAGTFFFLAIIKDTCAKAREEKMGHLGDQLHELGHLVGEAVEEAGQELLRILLPTLYHLDR